jgi:hypothetical protein
VTIAEGVERLQQDDERFLLDVDDALPGRVAT